uniref:Ubiquitin-related modifier 1 n=1 Tax=Balaenoptera musculus TaxID=9771 RepID=A0A8C0DND6_BALMU
REFPVSSASSTWQRPCLWRWSSGEVRSLLFDGVKKHQVTLPGQEEPWDIRNLLVWIKKNLLKERPELFIQGDSVRPGILVLINDADWELLALWTDDPRAGELLSSTAAGGGPLACSQCRGVGQEDVLGKPGSPPQRGMPASRLKLAGATLQAFWVIFSLSAKGVRDR